LARTGSAKATGGPEAAALQFLLATGDRVGVQTRDACEVGDASEAVVAGEETDKKSPGPFVGGSNEPVKAAMFTGHRTMRMLLAGWTSARMDVALGVFPDHVTVPPSGGP